MSLFCSGKDFAKERWDGARCVTKVFLLLLTLSLEFFRTSFEEATTIFGADEARPIEHFSSHLKSTIMLYSHVYVDLPPIYTRTGLRSAVKSILRHLSPTLPGRSEYDSIVESLKYSCRRPLAPEISRLRAIKSECEQRLMRAAADISALAHAKVNSVTVSHFPVLIPCSDYRQCVLHAQGFRKALSQLILSISVLSQELNAWHMCLL
jgi:intermediate cleaving peptidase 55